jgi:hypothetical protein
MISNINVSCKVWCGDFLFFWLKFWCEDETPITWEDVVQVIPLYAASPPKVGGLGLSPGHLAVPTTISGVILVLWALFGVAKAQAAFGAGGCCRFGVAAYAVIAMFLPVVSLLPQAKWVRVQRNGIHHVKVKTGTAGFWIVSLTQWATGHWFMQ